MKRARSSVTEDNAEQRDRAAWEYLQDNPQFHSGTEAIISKITSIDLLKEILYNDPSSADTFIPSVVASRLISLDPSLAEELLLGNKRYKHDSSLDLSVRGLICPSISDQKVLKKLILNPKTPLALLIFLGAQVRDIKVVKTFLEKFPNMVEVVPYLLQTVEDQNFLFKLALGKYKNANSAIRASLYLTIEGVSRVKRLLKQEVYLHNDPLCVNLLLAKMMKRGPDSKTQSKSTDILQELKNSSKRKKIVKKRSGKTEKKSSLVEILSN